MIDHNRTADAAERRTDRKAREIALAPVRSKSRKVNAYVRVALKRMKVYHEYERLTVELNARMNALNGAQLGEAARILTDVGRKESVADTRARGLLRR
jgi:hypothetical protein